MKTDSFKYLVPIDTLLDVRLGAVSLLDSAHAKAILFSDYQTRTNDTILYESKAYSKETYLGLLAKGDVSVLQHAFPTKMSNYLYEIIHAALVEAVIGTSVNCHEIVVNTHPYTLTSDEIEALKEIIELKVPNVDSVSVCSIPSHFISPTYLRNNQITHFINYDFASWLTMFVEVLMADPIPAITMICPKLLTKQVDELDDPETAKELLKTFSPYSAFELQFVLYIALRFIEVSYFSIFKPD